MGHRRAWQAQRTCRQEAHIPVLFELSPRPAFLVQVVNGEALAQERLGIERRLRRGRAAHGHLGLANLIEPPFDEAGCIDFAGEVLCREISPCRGEAWVEGSGRCLSHTAL